MIDGKRIFLRPVSFLDVTDEYCLWLNDKEVNKFLEVRFGKHTLETTRDYVKSAAEDEDTCFLAIVRKDTQKFIGTIKLGPINRTHGYADMSIMIGDKSSWGKGFASEAIELFADYAFRHLKIHKIMAGLYAENTGSYKAFLKAGFKDEFRQKNQYAFEGGFTDRIVLSKFTNCHKIMIALIGGGIVMCDNGVWVSPSFYDCRGFPGAPGSHERVLAASLLFKENPESLVVALGGKGQMKDIPGAPAVAEVLKTELLELGVPEESILEEKESGTTYEQLVALKRIAKNLLSKKILIVSNRYHLPRIEAMIDCAPRLAGIKDLKPSLLSAETILLQKNREIWLPIVEKAYFSNEILDLIRKENKGVEQVRNGTYKY